MLPDVLRRAEFAPLWRAVHERLSAGRPVGRVRVGPLDRRQREALADLLGADRLPGDHVSVSLPRLDVVLGQLCGRDSRAIAEELLGPVPDRASRRLREQRERARLWEWLRGHPQVRAQPALVDWAEQVRRNGLIGDSPAATGESLADALRVLANLPAPGASLPAFADEVLGDPRALEPGRPVSALVLRALSEVHGTPLPAAPGQRRELWLRAGIGEDPLSTVVLSAGVRPSGGRLGGEILRACADSGEVAALTLTQLRDTGPIALGARDVWVVADPEVLALAVRRFGSTCPPLVCTSGWPNGAGILLLRRLGAAGARLHYHGDLDGEGVRIAAHVLTKTRALPWRMSAADYLSAVEHFPAGPHVGRVTEAPWDAALAPAMRQHRTAVPEARLADALLDDIP
ncbi:TIGR02679 family protein [Saccharopolyspora sp. MS10]|uniref:TIGR02679 family protein n=1 Tax=Saccharopolyspora sp. MS10 TaxID=3385973 RepID=UPI0039A280B0